MKNIHVSIESGTDPRIYSDEYAEPLKVTVGEYCVYDSLTSSSSSQPQVRGEKEEHGWIRTADRPPTKEDGDKFGDVLWMFKHSGKTEVNSWEANRSNLWMPIPKLPDETPTTKGRNKTRRLTTHFMNDQDKQLLRRAVDEIQSLRKTNQSQADQLSIVYTFRALIFERGKRMDE